MPEWGYIVLFAAGIPLLVVLIIVIAHRGGTLNLGKAGSIVIHGEGEPKNAMERALRHVPENIGRIHSLLYGYYLKLVKAKGIDEVDMTDLEDSHFARVLLRVATSLGNGSQSVQKIIENDIASCNWDGRECKEYARHSALPRVIDSIRNVINSEYDSNAHYAEHSTRMRVVNQAEFVDMLKDEKLQDELVVLLCEFYEFAKHCLGGSK